MTYQYNHIAEAITDDELERQFVELVEALNLGDPGDLVEELVHHLRSDIRLHDAFKRAGLSLDKTRDIEHLVLFELASNAKQFAKALTKGRKGYRARVGTRVGDYWPVVVRNRSDLQLASIGQATVSMCMLALSYCGMYDGFEATIDATAEFGFNALKGEAMTGEQLTGSGISHRPGFALSKMNAKA